MPPRRPQPLCEDMFEGSHGAVLLGRTKKVSGAGLLKKAGDAAPAADPSPSPAKGDAEASPLDVTVGVGASFQQMTPLSTRSAQHWAFTPIATPSPSGRAAALEQLLAAGLVAPAGAALPQPQVDMPMPAAAPAVPADVGAACQGAPPVFVAMPAVCSKPLSALTLATTPARQPVARQPQQVMPAPFKAPVVAADPSPHRWSSERDDGSEESDSDDDGQQPQAVRAAGNVPQRPPGARLPSVGSAGHDLGSCKRCCFFPRGRCVNGYECEFCHCEHEKRKRRNKKKGKKVVASPVRGGRSPVVHTPSLSARAPPFVPRTQPTTASGSPVTPQLEQSPSFGFCVPSAPSFAMGEGYMTAAPTYSTLGPQCMSQPVMQAACYTCEGVPLASSPMSMGAERPGVYQLADGSCCMVQATPSTMPQFSPQPQMQAAVPPQPQQQPGSHVVMLEPAVMSASAQSPQPDAPPASSPRLARRDASPPPPPRAAPRLAPRAVAIAA